MIHKFNFAQNKKKIIILSASALVLVILLITVLILSGKEYSAGNFGIDTVKSAVDFNRNGIDDYTDFLIGAKNDAENHPTYDSRYWNEGYPPDDIGVCADVVWRAFANAGYCLRDMVDYDVNHRPEAYPLIDVPDNNIDFRRVRNLKIFFEEYAEKLTTNVLDTSEWQPGDIVIFNFNTHIGIVSDIRNFIGVSFILHNGGQEEREEDILLQGNATAHYRFNASALPDYILIPYITES